VAEIESKTDAKTQQKLKNMAQYMNQLSVAEQSYLDLLQDDHLSARDQLHPFILSLDYYTGQAKVNGEYLHPINYFLQQEGMAKLWRSRAGVGSRGSKSAGSKTASAAPKEEAKPEKVEVKEEVKSAEYRKPPLICC
jgi:hypothetical protein